MKNRLAVITLFALVSCAGNITEEVQEVKNQEYTIYAVNGAEPQVKNTIDDQAHITWTAGDAINVFFGSASSGRFVTAEAGEVAQFRGSVDIVTGGGEGLNDDTSLWGVYPYNSKNSCNGSNVFLTLPSVQTAAENTFASGLFPQIAKSTNFYMSFYNLCGGFRFSVSSPDIKYVTLSGNNNESIAGSVRVSMDKIPQVEEVVSGEKTITMYAPDGGTFKPGVNYYLVVFPTTFSKGLTLTYYKEETHASYVVSKEYILQRSQFSRFANRDSGLTFVPTPLNGWGEGERVEGEI